jgi:hypothetical protein
LNPPVAGLAICSKIIKMVGGTIEYAPAINCSSILNLIGLKQ